MGIYEDALRVAAIGFSVVFITIVALTFSTGIMSLIIRWLGRQKRGK